MSIPDYQTIMLPLLQFANDKKIHKFGEAVDYLSDYFGLSDSEFKELLPSGAQPIFRNRVAWAKTYLSKAGLLVSPKRGMLQITDNGLKVLSQNIDKIDNDYLKQFDSFVKFTTFKRAKQKKDSPVEDDTQPRTPEEILEDAFLSINEDLAFEILETLKSCSYSFFEVIVIDLLLKMGYGGSRVDAGKAIGKSGDGGIDGIIKEDKLGLDIIYIQAKRWENTVPVKEIRDFAGSLLSKKAKKGIFITTSAFPKSAHDFVKSIEPKIILIDGKQLADLMIEHNVGLSVNKVYEIKKIDTDYFEEN